ncbi:MAG: hypothetical protein JMDDDDMK_04533 [Acidobacteria bacterium]|nr:hypothetical protein [Acidobacteriota bacterium]
MGNGHFQTAATLIGGLGIGAGLMYLLDPDKGRRRRALVRDQMAHAAYTAEHAMGKASRDMSNRARGMVARTHTVFSTRRVPDDVLVARVRSHLGHTVSHPRAICVEARDGRVKLTGAALAREFDHLISSVLSVPGVTQVEDWLDVYRDSSHMPGLQGGSHRIGARRGFMERVWPPATRLIASLAGGALAVYGVGRRDALGAALSVTGAGMIAGGIAQGRSRRSSRALGRSRGLRSKGRHSARHRIAGRHKDDYYFREVGMADYSRGYERDRYGRRYDEDDERSWRGGRGRGREERGYWDRAGDEARSWFGDEEAERRRIRDDREYGREYGRGYGREGYRQGSRGDYERGYGEYGRGVSGYGREGYRGDYERGYGREYYPGEYSQGSYGYGREGYGQGYYSGSQEYGRGGRYGSEYGYGQSYSSPYWSYTEMWLVPGPYTGRGPSGYRRSDDRIIEDVNERLQQHGQIDASYVTVNVNNGEVTLTGTVDSRLEKRLAEDVAESCLGVKEVHNNLRVKGREQEQQNQYGQQTTTQGQYGSQSEPRSRYTTS